MEEQMKLQHYYDGPAHAQICSTQANEWKSNPTGNPDSKPRSIAA
jgi:hypothetical protein